jgi:hypothetical protein
LRDALARRHLAAVNGVFLPHISPIGARLSPSSWVVSAPASLISGSPRATGLRVYALPTVLTRIRE